MTSLNFDVCAVRWRFDWTCDPKYNNWGSPTCPEEPHSHRGFNPDHFVEYNPPPKRKIRRFLRG